MPARREVDAWFSRYDNPMKDVVLRLREIILAADARIDECIKWQAPTFTFEGNLASFYPKSRDHASLMFHLGAKIPGRHPRLVGSGGTSRVMKIGSLAEADAARADLERLVRAWCDWRSPGAVAPSQARSTRSSASRPPSGRPARKPATGRKPPTPSRAKRRRSRP
jgi:uncharacterized protein YdhG (YjbR/CyaY superfamily)